MSIIWKAAPKKIAQEGRGKNGKGGRSFPNDWREKGDVGAKATFY